MPGSSEPPTWNFPGNIRDALLAERQRLLERLTPEQQSVAWQLRAALTDWQRPGRYEDLGAAFATCSSMLDGELERENFLAANRLLIADLATRLPHTIATRRLPSEVLALYPSAAIRLIAYLREVDDPAYCYPYEYFVKDLRFTAGLTVPCGAQVVDLRGVVGRKTLLHWLGRKPSPRNLAIALRWRGQVPWFRIHTESRHLDDFNEPGWDACYVRIAALLRMHPEVQGMVGTSWFYDPQLESVSPRLNYLRRRPVAGGAMIVRHGTSAFDIRAATATSKTRRRLYEAGRYTPRAYTLLWPREALLDWATAEDGKRP